ncbi:MAG: CoA transferase [Proteobacteria bacterium]|nr:CoA transferase [Pseudomonadota bacterium]HQR04696.1 CoA transferase [Rhodocyclaceae bacterium]
MAGVLEGLKVLDLTWGTSGPMATMLMSDHGAEVTRIERPGIDPFPAPEGYRIWQRGKRSAVLDLQQVTDRETLLALAAGADVLIESFEPGVTARLGIDFATIHARNPRLIYCSITAYGRDNSLSHRPGYDALVAARMGLQWEARGWYGSAMDRIQGKERKTVEMDVPDSVHIGSARSGPIFTATQAPSVVAAYQAVLGISAALRARELTGRGQWVETSLAQAVIMSNGCSWQRPQNIDAPGYQFNTSDQRQTWGIVKTKDGYICTWASPVEWFLVAGAGDKLRVPAPGEVKTRSGAMPRIEDRLRLLDEAAPMFARFTSAEWTRIAAESGEISVQPVRSPEEALCDPALLAEGAVVEIDDPELGVLREAGVLYRLSERPTRIRGKLALRGEHTEAVRKEAARAASPAATGSSTGRTLKGPFEGIRILDLGSAVAGPWATQLLCDMGAEVIKVDALRQTFWMACHMSLGVNRSKRFLGLDVKTAEGQTIIRRLVEEADVVVHNMRPQAARKLGLDYETLRRVNSRLVYCHTRGFEDSPRSELPGNDQTANSLGGANWEDGGCGDGGRPWFGITSNGDLGNGYLASIAIAQALYDREKTGKGQFVDTSILNASLFNCSRAFTNREGKRFPRQLLDRDQTGFSALYRIYPCQDAEGWLCLAAVSGQHWQTLTRLFPALDDARFATPESRQHNDKALAAILGEIFRGMSSEAAFRLLDNAGVPCEISDITATQKMFDNPEFIARRWVAGLDGHPLLGRIDMFGVGIDFSDTPCRIGGPPPVPWQHTQELLREMGYGDERIDQLAAEGTAILPKVA